MGKSTVAAMFSRQSVPVFDADQARLESTASAAARHSLTEVCRQCTGSTQQEAPPWGLWSKHSLVCLAQTVRCHAGKVSSAVWVPLSPACCPGIDRRKLSQHVVGDKVGVACHSVLQRLNRLPTPGCAGSHAALGAHCAPSGAVGASRLPSERI